jgi:hypothetical protein
MNIEAFGAFGKEGAGIVLASMYSQDGDENEEEELWRFVHFYLGR